MMAMSVHRTASNCAMPPDPTRPELTDAHHPLPDGRHLSLLPERAAWLADAGLLLVADVHFGKAASFRRLGVPVPSGTTAANLARLDALLARLTGAAVRELVFLGDFLHAASGRAPATLAALQAWRERHADLAMTLVRGNHDDHAGDPPPELFITVVDEPWHHAGLALCHDPATPCPPGLYAVAGHLHPTAVLGRGFDALRMPCFHARAGSSALDGRPDTAGVLLLPAFGEFTGGAAVVRASPGDALYVVAGDHVVRLPGAAHRKKTAPPGMTGAAA
jgi:DNA ligase-associated metallophosphoesterase